MQVTATARHSFKTALLMLSVLLFLGVICSCSGGSSSTPEDYRERALSAPPSARELALWNQTVSQLLVQPLWEKRDIADSAQHLMVPLHAAFQSGDRNLKREFSDHFGRFMAHLGSSGAEYRANDLIDRLEYLYFASQFMLLSSIYGAEVPEDLYQFVLAEALTTYTTFGGPWELAASADMRSRINRIISGKAIMDQKYYRAVTDFEFFTIAIMCDLLVVERHQKKQSAATAMLEEASGLALDLFRSQTVFAADGGWVFQPGVWSDHPSYQYAGNAEVLPELEVKVVQDIGMDSSHFHRMPLHLRSYLYAQRSAEGRQFFSTLTAGLKTHLAARVLVQPTPVMPYFRMMNFMSGHNGVYRYSYHVTGTGYGPYQLSRTMLLGWWSFLADREISGAYNAIASNFPFNDAARLVYSDPVTVREQNIFYSSQTDESEQLLELICSLAGKLQ